jgi:hypothetical protein
MLSRGLNSYVCNDGHETVVYEMDKGIAPFILPCATCQNEATTTYYRVENGNRYPSYVLYRAEKEEVEQMSEEELYRHERAWLSFRKPTLEDHERMKQLEKIRFDADASHTQKESKKKKL